MNATSARIAHLSDAEVLRVALWFFDQEREKRDDELANARLKDLASEDIIADFNAAIRAQGLESLEPSPEPTVLAAVLRDLLIARAEKQPEEVAEVMRGLGMEAGGDLIEVFSQHFSYIPIILVLLRGFEFELKRGPGTRWQLRIKSGFPPELLNVIAKLTGSRSVLPDSNRQNHRD